MLVNNKLSNGEHTLFISIVEICPSKETISITATNAIRCPLLSSTESLAFARSSHPGYPTIFWCRNPGFFPLQTEQRNRIRDIKERPLSSTTRFGSSDSDRIASDRTCLYSVLRLSRSNEGNTIIQNQVGQAYLILLR